MSIYMNNPVMATRLINKILKSTKDNKSKIGIHARDLLRNPIQEEEAVQLYKQKLEAGRAAVTPPPWSCTALA